MSNLINRTELFNELSRVPISQYAVDERTMIYNKINGMPTAETTGDLDDAIQEYIKSGLMELDDLRPKGHWIPCSERLPDTEVLCCDKYGAMIIAYVYEDDTSDTGFSAESETQYMYNCIAWMQLPEPYKEQNERSE